MAYCEDVVEVFLLEDSGCVFYSFVSAQSCGVDYDCLFGDAAFCGCSFHGLGFVDAAVSGASGEDERFCETFLVKIASCSNAVGEGVRHLAGFVDSCSEYYYCVCFSCVVCFAETEHLCQGECCCAEGEEDECCEVLIFETLGGAFDY